MSVKWILACKEYQGRIYVSRLPKTELIDPLDPKSLYRPGVPSPWFQVGPGLRPSVQHYEGNDNSFILTFEYLSHLTCRIIPNVDETTGGTWPPATLDPVTFSAGNWTVQLPEEAIAAKLLSQAGSTNVSYYFNPILLSPSILFFDTIANLWSVDIKPAIGWVPLAVAPVFYRVYRRPLTGGPWTMRKDWAPFGTTDILNLTETQNGGVFQFQYTATWGSGANLDDPNDINLHNEGVIGDGTILSFDSNIPPVFFTTPSDDSISVPLLMVEAGYGHFEPAQQFLNIVTQTPPTNPQDAEISLEEVRLGTSSFGTCHAEASQSFSNEFEEDELLEPAGVGKVQSGAAPAGMF